MNMEKSALVELEKRVSEVLFYIWDPLDINEEPWMRDEYENYVAGILNLVVQGKTLLKIAEYICEIESQKMSLTPDEKRAVAIASRLVEHREQLELHFKETSEMTETIEKELEELYEKYLPHLRKSQR